MLACIVSCLLLGQPVNKSVADNEEIMEHNMQVPDVFVPVAGLFTSLTEITKQSNAGRSQMQQN